MPIVKRTRRVSALALATSLAGCANAGGGGVSNVSVASALDRSRAGADGVSPAVLHPRTLAPSLLGAAPSHDRGRTRRRAHLFVHAAIRWNGIIYPLDDNDKTFIGDAANIFNNTLTVLAPGSTKLTDSLRDSKLVSPF